MENIKYWARRYRYRILLFLSIFGPATITAMADNDASGVATYAIAGAKLGYPVLFVLGIVTIVLGVTQEMGIRMSLVTRKGLGDMIREQFGVRVSLFIFLALLVANMGTIIVDLAAVKTMSTMLHIPEIPAIIATIVITFLLVTRGSYKSTQNAMLFACLFFLAYIFSAFQSHPDWNLAITNLLYPHGALVNPDYLKNYLIIGLGVLGTTVTPWGQFFISSFIDDKHIDTARIKYSQLETYVGAFLTNFFSFFMVVATAATLFVNKIPLLSGEQAALAIQPFAGELAGVLFAVGILNAGFMGIVVVSLSTAYAFSEFFGYSGSLDISFNKSREFYILFLGQLIVAAIAIMLPGVSLFKLAIASQALNAMILPFVFYYLIKITNDRQHMGEFVNTPFQKWFAIVATCLIAIASLSALIVTFFHL